MNQYHEKKHVSALNAREKPINPKLFNGIVLDTNFTHMMVVIVLTLYLRFYGVLQCRYVSLLCISQYTQ